MENDEVDVSKLWMVGAVLDHKNKEKAEKKSGAAVLLRSDGTSQKVMPDQSDGSFSLEELYRLIETDLVEVVHLPKGFIMIVDEEGKLKARQVNEAATAVINVWGNPDYIVGNALVCLRSQLK